MHNVNSSQLSTEQVLKNGPDKVTATGCLFGLVGRKGHNPSICPYRKDEILNTMHVPRANTRINHC